MSLNSSQTNTPLPKFEHSTNNNQFVKSFAKGLAVLEVFDGNDGKMTLTEVAKKVGITRAAARRLLLTLESLGYAVQNKKKFELTTKVLNMSKSHFSNNNIWQIVRKHLKTLVNNIDEVGSAVVLDGSNIKYMARVGTPGRVFGTPPKMGHLSPAHLNSSGRAILAQSSAKNISDYLENADFNKQTEFSLTSPMDLPNMLKQVKSDGYCIINQELQIGLRTISIPFFDNQHKLRGALTVGSHISRVTEDHLLQTILPALHKCSDSIIEELEFA